MYCKLLFFDPDAQGSVCAAEYAVSLFIDHDLVLHIAESIDPGLTCVLLAGIHCLIVACPVCEDNCQAVSAVCFIAFHCPADYVRIVKIVMLRAVYVRP